MAEAAVEDRPASKFYCHLCNVQFENASANYTCPHCSKGFIEELDLTGDNSEDIVDVTDSDDDNIQVDDETLTRLASTHLRQHPPFENLIQEFIVNLGVGVNWGGGGNMQVFLGNPGDYAWGREGLDAIVTQLLNQMDTSGPPPLSKDVIDALPIVEVTEPQVNSKLQCSVCWEDFSLKEKVRQLPCQHVYHEPCIRPWLELHGTCPICRQNLVTGEQQNNSDVNQSSPGNLTLQQLFQVVQNSGGTSSSGSSDTSASSSSSSSYSSDSTM
ncbi:e3 ubiquitin-protein ligase praja [Holotrichia oblita]|uniref:E3 ubiquitin-protein ligase praja n=2 Tax=Holotrichia oblita TaxID=644536 RepID=A0ACB9SZJ9_HOLOL|nr:e3 ubiquitin-protein ligase praja [Holotrichia oblita]KAI4460022.1 e3 ubiquitin-protein ligase praja [Holotrichia oblita]